MRAQELLGASPAPRTIQEFIGSEFRAEMARKGVTQDRLAAVLGITGPTLSKRLNGKQPMTVDFILTVCDLLEMSDDRRAALITWKPAPVPPPSKPTGSKRRRVKLPRLDSNQEPFGSPLRLHGARAAA